MMRGTSPALVMRALKA
jgi:hypothetical protein